MLMSDEEYETMVLYDQPVSEDFYTNLNRACLDVDTIPDSDTREDDLAAIVDYKTLKDDPERIKGSDCINFKEEK